VERLKAVSDDYGASDAAAGIKELDAGMRRDFNVAIGVEVERLRDVTFSAVEWQNLHPDALRANEVLFQRFLDSHTPESMQGGVAALVAKAVQAALASSPDRGGQVSALLFS